MRFANLALSFSQSQFNDFFSTINKCCFVCIGDSKRYNANKHVLGENSIWANSDEEAVKLLALASEDCKVVCICGEAEVNDTFNSAIVVHLCQIITYYAQRYWNSRKEYIGVDLNHYGSNPYIAEYISRISPREQMWYVSDYFNKNKNKKLKVLSIGCGCGHLERVLSLSGMCSEIHGCDISPDSIAIARDKARGIHNDCDIKYFVCDVNMESWNDHYDVIICFYSVHHLERLEFFYSNVRSALSPGGIFIQSEFVGAARFQYSPQTVCAVNVLLSILPNRFKIKNKFVKKTLNDILYDPSEAIRSEEIIPLTKKFFPRSNVGYAPGLIMMLLYYCINTSCFHSNKKRSKRLCRLVFSFERVLHFTRLVRHANAIIISHLE